MDWRIKQDGMIVASGSGAALAAKREAAHYALMYAQDGPPVEMSYRASGQRWKFITRVEIATDTE